jgi:hypothetical protein
MLPLPSLLLTGAAVIFLLSGWMLGKTLRRYRRTRTDRSASALLPSLFPRDYQKPGHAFLRLLWLTYALAASSLIEALWVARR